LHGHHLIPLLLAHVEDHPVAEDAGVVHEDIDAAELIDGGLDDVLAAVHRGDRVVVGDGFVAFRHDLGDDLIGGAVVVARAVRVDASVVDDDLRAFFRHQESDATPDAAAGAGDYGDFVSEGVHVLPPAS